MKLKNSLLKNIKVLLYQHFKRILKQEITPTKIGRGDFLLVSESISLLITYKNQNLTLTTKTQSRYADTKITKGILYFFFVPFALLCDLCV